LCRAAIRQEETNQAMEPATYSSGELTPEKACLTIAALQPENAIIVDEGITSVVGYHSLTSSCVP
jgi:hypothetical protein